MVSVIGNELATSAAVVKVLEQAGVRTVFALPGGDATNILNALYGHSTIRTVLVREEGLGTIMAEVTGRWTGRPGVVVGQGAWILANGGLGTIEAHAGSSPMVIISDLSDAAPYAHHGPYQSGTGDYGSFDVARSFEGITKRVFVATTPVEAVQKTQLAFRHALAGEPGPVVVLLGSQAIFGKVDAGTRPRVYLDGKYYAVPGCSPEESSVAAAARALEAAEAPVIIAGGGVRVGKAYSALEDLSRQLDCPVATTAAGKGVFAEDSDLALGVFGSFGTDVANSVIGAADLVLAVGTKLGPTDTASEHTGLIDPARQTLIHIDTEVLNTCWSYPADHVIVGDANAALDALMSKARDVSGHGRSRVAEARSRLGWFDSPEYESTASPLRPERVIRSLRNCLPEDAIFVCDAGENRLFMTHFFQARTPGTFLQPASSGGMGYAIPAAMATKLVYPDRCVVAVCGDGGFGMSMQGLMTALEEDIPIVVVVFNNHALGWVLHGQREKPFASKFGTFDHAAIARSMGCAGHRAATVDELEAALRDSKEVKVATLIDVEIDLTRTYRDISSPRAGAVLGAE